MAYLIKTENSNNIILIALHTKKRRTKPNQIKQMNKQTNNQPYKQKATKTQTNKTKKEPPFLVFIFVVWSSPFS